MNEKEWEEFLNTRKRPYLYNLRRQCKECGRPITDYNKHNSCTKCRTRNGEFLWRKEPESHKLLKKKAIKFLLGIGCSKIAEEFYIHIDSGDEFVNSKSPGVISILSGLRENLKSL